MSDTTTTPDWSRIVCSDPSHEGKAVKAVELGWVGPADLADGGDACFGCGRDLENDQPGVVLYLFGLPVGRECLERLSNTIEDVRRYDRASDALDAGARAWGFDPARVLDVVGQVAQINGTKLTPTTVRAATKVLRDLTVIEAPF